MVELNGGVRLELAKGTFQNVPLGAYPPGTAALTALPAGAAGERRDALFLRVGAVFQAERKDQYYAAFGNARTPTSATVRLGCGRHRRGRRAGPVRRRAETARNYEIGVKADVLGRRLQLTAALFRNERSNFRVPSNDPVAPHAAGGTTGARGSMASRSAPAAISPASGRSSPITLTARPGAAERFGFLPGAPRPCLPQRRRAARSAGRRRADPDAQAFGESLHHLPAAVRAPARLRAHLPGQVRHPAGARSCSATQYFADDYLIHRLFMAYEFARASRCSSTSPISPTRIISPASATM